MKKTTIIQARMGSSRLPGKVMKDLAGKPVLQRVIERCQASNISDVIVATPLDDSQKPILDLCAKLGVTTFQGSENNVLERTYQVAKAHNIDIIVDVTSDCPLVDPKIINELLESFNDMSLFHDYACNVSPRSFPAGFDVQVYTLDAFDQLYKMSKADKRIITEHSGWNFTQCKDKFGVYSITPNYSCQYPEWRLTLDTQKDYELISWLYSVMKDEIWNHAKIIDFIKFHILDFVSYDSMAAQANPNSIYHG